jgi:hypothetical protein
MRLRTLAPLITAIALGLTASTSSAVTVPRKTVAYVTYTKSVTSQVWTTSPGGAPAKVATGYAPVVSPDGDLVAYTAGNGASSKLVVAPVGGGAARTLAKNVVGTPAWSPDQQHLVVAVGPEIGKQTLVDVNVADAKQLKLATGYFSGASYAPDGGSIAYGRTAKDNQQGTAGDVFVVHPFPDGASAPRNVTADGRSVSPLWGREGIVFSHLSTPKKKEDYPKANLQLVQPDGTGRRTLTKLKVPYLLYGLTATAFSADGKRLLAEYGGQDYSEAWTYDFATGRARDLTGKADGVIGFGISGDGGTVLAGTGGYDPQAKSDVVTYSFAGKNRKTLVKNGTWATWAGF